MLDPAKLSMNGINNSLQSELTDDDKSIGEFLLYGEGISPPAG